MCGVCGVCGVCVFAPIHCEQFLRIVALSSPKDILNYAVVSIRYSFTGDVPIASLVQFKRSSLPGYRAPKRSKYSSLPLGSFVGGQIGLVLLRLGFGCHHVMCSYYMLLECLPFLHYRMSPRSDVSLWILVFTSLAVPDLHCSHVSIAFPDLHCSTSCTH